MPAETILPLHNAIRSYAWGSRDGIAMLRGEAPSAEPQAELWMGAHPNAPSRVRTGSGEMSLDRWIARDPESALGRAAASSSQLPFLFKVLSAAQPLSIQAHPNAQQARAGFDREERAGIPLDARNRCYVDPNPKPELICALTPFLALNRFRNPSEVARAFAELGAADWAERGPRVLLATLLRLDRPARQALLDRALEWARGAGRHHDGCEWLGRLAEAYPGDIGALAPLLLNVVELSPGEAMYLPAGELHAYLEGTGLELMASSDNVLRGGLTSKHVDPEQLLSVLTDSAGPVEVLRPVRRAEGEAFYRTPAREFELSVIQPRVADQIWTAEPHHGVEILLCTAGACEIACPEREAIRLASGDSVFVSAAAPAYTIRGEATLYRASTPHGVRTQSRA